MEVGGAIITESGLASPTPACFLKRLFVQSEAELRNFREVSRVLHLAGRPFKKFVSISALFIICWFRFSDIDIDIRIPVLGDQTRVSWQNGNVRRPRCYNATSSTYLQLMMKD